MWHLRLGPCSCVDVGAVSRVIPSLAHKAPLRPGTYCGGSDVTRATSGWAAAPLCSTQLWKNGICMKASLSFITWDILLARSSSRSLPLSPWLVDARQGPSVVRDHFSPSANSLIASSSISLLFFFQIQTNLQQLCVANYARFTGNWVFSPMFAVGSSFLLPDFQSCFVF